MFAVCCCFFVCLELFCGLCVCTEATTRFKLYILLLENDDAPHSNFLRLHTLYLRIYELCLILLDNVEKEKLVQETRPKKKI